MTNKKYIVALVAVLIIAIIGWVMPVGQNGQTIVEKLGVVPGNDFYETPRFWAGVGGQILATSTSGTATTLNEKTLNDFTVIEMTPNVAAFTYTLPATSTLSGLLKKPGDTRTWIIENATSTAGATITVAKGTGWDLTGVDANVDVIAGAAAGSEVYMKLDCTRKSNKDIVCLISENIAAD